MTADEIISYILLRYPNSFILEPESEHQKFRNSNRIVFMTRDDDCRFLWGIIKYNWKILEERDVEYKIEDFRSSTGGNHICDCYSWGRSID